MDPISIAMGLRDEFQKEVSLASIREAVQAFSRLLHMERQQRYVSSQVALMFDIIENGHAFNLGTSTAVKEKMMLEKEKKKYKKKEVERNQGHGGGIFCKSKRRGRSPRGRGRGTILTCRSRELLGRVAVRELCA